jgi:hypothetical protein
MPQALSNAVKGHGYQTLKTIAFNGLANTFTRLRNHVDTNGFYGNAPALCRAWRINRL